MISVIIPTFEEARSLPLLLGDLAEQDAAFEAIVADGGSRDGTSELAVQAGACLVRSAPGRGRQLIAGVTRARGDILFFLHADCRLAPGSLARIEEVLAENPSSPGGNFRLFFDGDDGFSRWLDGFYAFIRRRGFYYGDSGVFVRRAAYEALGGFRPIPVMEDYDFNRRMERAGKTACIDTPPLVTSSRKFEGRRPAAIVIGWLVVHALYHLRIPPEWLARLYYPKSWWHRRGATP